MGNSAVYRIHTGDDVREAYDMAQRLLALAETACDCRPGIVAEARTGTHAALDRYLAVEGATVALSVPADLVPAALAALRLRAGSRYPSTDLRPDVITALRRLPPMTADISSGERPLPSELAEVFLAVVGRDRASISWDVCWPGNHNRSGVQLGINGEQMWHPAPPAGHSLYVHVAPEEPEQAHDLAAAVGGRVLGGPARGW